MQISSFHGMVISEEFEFNSSTESEQQTRVPATASVYFRRNLSKGIFLSTTAMLALNALCDDASTFSSGDGMI